MGEQMTDVTLQENQTPAKAQLNWTEAFTMFCIGASNEEIAEALEIPIGSLVQKIHKDRWGAMKNKLAPRLGVGHLALDQKTEERINKIEQNREKNLRAFERLRNHATSGWKDRRAHV